MRWVEDFHNLVFPLKWADLDIEAGFNLKNKNIPKSLYKYRSFDEEGRSLKNLEEDTVWLADPLTFNDPYDCHHYIDYEGMLDVFSQDLPDDLRELITPLMRDSLAERSAGVISELNKAGDKIKDGIRLCSFSERVDSTLMWAHYSYNHQGFCIEYDVTRPELHKLTSRFMFPVVYSDDVFDATDLMNVVKGGHFNNLRLNLAALYKATDWSYEKEWRLVFANHFMQAPCPWGMPKPTAVFCGSHISKANEAKIKEVCCRREIPLFKMELDRHMYRMNPRKL